jgi:hypothetical protein
VSSRSTVSAFYLSTGDLLRFERKYKCICHLGKPVSTLPTSYGSPDATQPGSDLESQHLEVDHRSLSPLIAILNTGLSPASSKQHVGHFSSGPTENYKYKPVTFIDKDNLLAVRINNAQGKNIFSFLSGANHFNSPGPTTPPFTRSTPSPAATIKAHSSCIPPAFSVGETISTPEKPMTSSPHSHESSSSSDEDEHFPLVHRHRCRISDCNFQCWMERNFRNHEQSHNTD